MRDLIEAVVAGHRLLVRELVQKEINAGISQKHIIENGLIPGLDLVGDMFEKGEIFFPEMLMSAVAVKEGMQDIKKRFERNVSAAKATLVLGTVAGDLHDIGKNLIALILRGKGFRVLDLGVNVQSSAFVDAVQEKKPDVVGLSALVTTTVPAMKDVIEALIEAGLRESVKVIIGGAPTTSDYASTIGADGWAQNGISAARLIDTWNSRGS